MADDMETLNVLSGWGAQIDKVQALCELAD